MEDTLRELREQLSSLDTQLLQIVAQRTAISLQIGRVKREMGRGTRDFTREKVVFERAQREAAALGLAPDLVERLTRTLITASLSAQEQDRVAHAGRGDGQRAMVIGGSGRMGGWLVTFLAAQGYDVEIADPVPTTMQVRRFARWQDAVLDHDLVALAAPLETTREILMQLAESPPSGVVFDIGSLKRPLQEGLFRLRDAGGSVTSIHPMFGPDTSLLSGRQVLFVDVGVPEATEAVRGLFTATMATQVDVELEVHDRLMSVVLGMAHAANLTFYAALEAFSRELPQLRTLASPTYDMQRQVAYRLAGENPQLNFELQALNHFSADSLATLQQAMARLQALVAEQDEVAFRAEFSPQTSGG